MDGLNKIISFVLGFIVVIIIVAIIIGRLNIAKRFLSSTKGGLAAGISVTPTPTGPTGTITPTATPTGATTRRIPSSIPTGTTGGGTTTIPKTGPEAQIWLLALVALGTGYVLRKTSH